MEILSRQIVSIIYYANQRHIRNIIALGTGFGGLCLLGNEFAAKSTELEFPNLAWHLAQKLPNFLLV